MQKESSFTNREPALDRGRQGGRSLLLLTATVAPTVAVTRADPDTRLADYIGALARWWQAFAADPVDLLFCENSGYALTKLDRQIGRLRAGSRIRTLQFLGNRDLVALRGKGAGEAEMFDECIRRGEIGTYDYVIKATGRLFVANGRELWLETLKRKADWAISFRSPLDFVDARFFIVRGAMFSAYLSDLGEEVNDARGVYLEHAMLRRVCRAIGDGCRWGRFESLPRYDGVGATDGKRHSSLAGRLRYAVKDGLHQFGVGFGSYWYL